MADKKDVDSLINLRKSKNYSLKRLAYKLKIGENELRLYEESGRMPHEVFERAKSFLGKCHAI